MKKRLPTSILIILLLLLVIIEWGIVGGAISQDSSKKCFLGIGENLCWMLQEERWGMNERVSLEVSRLFENTSSK